MKSCLVGLLFLLSAVAFAGTCPLNLYDAASYNPESTKVDDPVSCGWYEKDSCCTATHSTEGVRVQFGDIPDGCSDVLNIMLCGTCSPDQGVFITGSTTDGFKYKICKGFCSKIFGKCADATFGGKKVSEYTSADAFCAAALTAGMNNTDVYTAEGNCFDAAPSVGPAAALLSALLLLLLL